MYRSDVGRASSDCFEPAGVPPYTEGPIGMSMSLGLDDVPAGSRAVADREAVKVLVRP